LWLSPGVFDVLYIRYISAQKRKNTGSGAGRSSGFIIKLPLLKFSDDMCFFASKRKAGQRHHYSTNL
jgi:hypothetical protein